VRDEDVALLALEELKANARSRLPRVSKCLRRSAGKKRKEVRSALQKAIKPVHP